MIFLKKSFAVIFLIIVTAGTISCYAKNEADKITAQGNITGENPKRAVSSLTVSPLNLDELLNFARSRNPELQSAYHLWKAAEEKIPQVKSLPDPKISYSYFIERVQTKTGPQEHKIGVSQTFPWLEKLSLKGKIALKEAEAIYQDYVSINLKLAQRVKSAFYEYAYLAQAVRINKEHLNILKAMEQVASIRFKSGSLPQNNLIQLQVEQGKIEDRVKELEALRDPLSSELYADMGMKSSDVLPWPDTSDNEIAQLDEQDLNLFMLNHNPILKKTGLLDEKEKFSMELAGKEYYPDLTFGFNRIYVDGGDDPMNITASINIPIWFNRINAAKREALERHESVSHTFADQENQLSAQLDLVLYYFRDAQRKSKLYMNTLIPKARQAIDVALKGFATGKVNFADLLDAQRSLLEFQLSAKRQAANTYIRLAQIETLVGKELRLTDQKQTKE